MIYRRRKKKFLIETEHKINLEMAEDSSGRIYIMAVTNSTDLALEHFLACTKKLRDGVHYSLCSS